MAKITGLNRSLFGDVDTEARAKGHRDREMGVRSFEALEINVEALEERQRFEGKGYRGGGLARSNPPTPPVRDGEDPFGI